MRVFSVVYDKVIQWSKHKRATWYLAGLSFSESSFLPFPPPDVMLAPMVLARMHLAWKLAFITTIFSVLGGLFGYLIGMLAFDFVMPLIIEAGYWSYYEKTQKWFVDYGVWAVIVAGFSPIPYKVFTLAAGVSGMAILPFLMASLVGRGARFFLVAGLIVLGGAKMEHLLRQYIDWLGWFVVVIVILVILII